MRRFSFHITSSKMFSWTKRSGARAADVALVEVDAIDDSLDSLVDRGILENDIGGLSSQFEGDPFFRRGDRFLNQLSRHWSNR